MLPDFLFVPEMVAVSNLGFYEKCQHFNNSKQQTFFFFFNVQTKPANVLGLTFERPICSLGFKNSEPEVHFLWTRNTDFIRVTGLGEP